MGLLSWLFPSDADRLAKARALMAKAKWEEARKALVHCGAAEAEALYEECSKALDRAEAGLIKKRARAQGFRGWKVEVTVKERRARVALENLLAQELAAAGIDLENPELDEPAVKAVFARAQKKARSRGISALGEMRLVPVIATPAP